MADSLTAIFGQPFAQQLAAWRLRRDDRRGTRAWTDVEPQFHDRAFMVAGAMKADLLSDLAAAVDKAISKGTSLEDFRRDFRATVARHGWHGWTGEGTLKGEAWRTRTIYRTNLASTYHAGRHAQLIEGDFAFWVYLHGNAREPRIIHLSWHGFAAHPSHPFWRTHFAPNGWGCTCYIVGARTAAGVRRLGGDPDKQLPPGWDRIDPKTGAPVGIDRGWGYAPGGTNTDLISAAARQIARLPLDLGIDFGQSVQPQIQRAWPDWVDQVKSGARHDPGLVGTIEREVADILAARGMPLRSAELLVMPGLIQGPKARRHHAAGDALTPEDWAGLPDAIRARIAVLLDKRTGRLIYVLPGDDRVPQLAIDMAFGRLDGQEAPNVIVSAYRPRMSDLRGRQRGGLLEVLLGSLG